MVQLPATVVVLPEWLTSNEVEATQAADMDTVLTRLTPGHPRLAEDTTRTERVSVPWSYLAPLPLVHR